MVLYDLRTTRSLTLRAVTRQAGCDFSLLSRVETGHRQLQPWLAAELDRIYATGTMIASLLPNSGGTPQDSHRFGVPLPDVFVVLLPQGGVTMPVSRREVTTALGLGIVTGPLQRQFERALDGIKVDGEEVLASSQAALSGFQEAIRVSAPARLIDAMTGQVAVLEGVRRRIAGAQRRQYATQAAHYAEVLSWLSEEAGDLPGAMWWIDRAAHWAQAAGWMGMTAFLFGRRSMVASFCSDGLRVVDLARPVLEMPQASPRMKGFAAKQMAAGYALVDQRDESRRALDAAMNYLAQPLREDEAALSRLHVASDDLLAVRRRVMSTSATASGSSRCWNHAWSRWPARRSGGPPSPGPSWPGPTRTPASPSGPATWPGRPWRPSGGSTPNPPAASWFARCPC